MFSLALNFYCLLFRLAIFYFVLSYGPLESLQGSIVECIAPLGFEEVFCEEKLTYL